MVTGQGSNRVRLECSNGVVQLRASFSGPGARNAVQITRARAVGTGYRCTAYREIGAGVWAVEDEASDA